jgi:hypothetical protein
MKRSNPLFCKRTSWQGRTGYVVGNQVLRLTTLTGGGHIADLRLENVAGPAGVNPLWTPPWRTIDPHQYRERNHLADYGSITEGKLLSGIVGHSICLDYFGLPSAEEAKHGLSLHGEAPSSKWRRSGMTLSSQRVALTLSVDLPVSGLGFSREIELRNGEAVVYFKEVVSNKRKADHFFHWTQHVTLGLPFLAPGESEVAIPGTKGLTFPHGYDEGKALLASNLTFRWPNAPLIKGGTVDLNHPFPTKGLGFVVAVLLDKKKGLGYIAAVNRKLGLLVAYCFKRSDFPWVAIWEENLAIAAPPWRQRTRARGLEFGTTPLPVARREAFAVGKLFGEPTLTCVPALGQKTVHYVALLARIPTGFGNVKDIEVSPKQVVIRGSAQQPPVCINASGLNRLLE